MAVTLVFLGRLEDAAGCDSMTLDIDAPQTIAQLARRLDPELAVAIGGKDIRVAIDGNIVDKGEAVVRDGAELAFLPPVSGG